MGENGAYCTFLRLKDIKLSTGISEQAARLEAASAALARGLPSEFCWDEIALKSRQIVADEAALEVRQRLNSTALRSAARALESLAQFAPSCGGAQARLAGLWAAGAFAANGNFPAAKTVVRRTFPRLGGREATTQTLLLALAPALVSEVAGHTPFNQSLRALLAGEAVREAALWQTWHEVAQSEKAPDIAPPEIWSLARAGLENALWLATTKQLRDFNWPDGFVARLTQHVPLLLPPQVEALEAGLLTARNSIIGLPPGTGKTLLGELVLATALADETGTGVFLVPYVALGRGVVEALRAHFPASVEVVPLFGRLTRDKIRPVAGARIIVATPESFDALVRHQPALWKELRALVVDEAHSVSEGARGVRVEGLITRFLKEQRTGGTARLALLSAALDDFEPLQQWIKADVVIANEWTPTARRLAFWRQGGVLEWYGQLADGRTVTLGETPLRWPAPGLTAGDEWVKVQQQEPLAWQNVAHLARRLHEERGGAILCLCATRKATRDLGRALFEAFPEKAEVVGALASAINLIEASYPPLLPLAQLLRRGVAWHNSSLPHPLRALIEAAVREGTIHAVAATTTLAEGVDLPFAQTILAQWMQWGDERQQPISPALFRNIAGRCGRAGAFTEGDTLVFDNPHGPLEWTAPAVRQQHQESLYLAARLTAPRSALAALEMEESGVFSVATPGQKAIRSAFESQLLALALENRGTEQADFLAGRSVYPLVESLHSHWKEQGILAENRQLTRQGELFARTELSSLTCRKLRDVLAALPTGRYNDVGGQARLLAYLWRSLGAVPEAGTEVARLFKPRSRLVIKGEDLELVARLWLRGEPLETLFAALPRASRWQGVKHWAQPRDFEGSGVSLAQEVEWAREYDAFCDFMRGGFESWAPHLWRASAALAPLAAGQAAQVDWHVWAPRWMHGVDSAGAVQLLEAGAIGGRCTVAVLGRELGHDFAAEPQATHEAIQRAMHAVGGPYCQRGQAMKTLVDWLCARLGWSK